MRDPLRPLHEREELFVSCLADVSHRVVGLQTGVRRMGEVETPSSGEAF